MNLTWRIWGKFIRPLRIRGFWLGLLAGLALAAQVSAEDAIPPAFAGTWRRTEVIDKKTGQGAPAARRYFMIMRADGQVRWLGTRGAPDYPPMKIVIRNGSDMYQVTTSGEKAIGKAIVEGNHLKMLFHPTPIHVDSGYVRVSKSVDPKDVEGKKP